MDPNLFSSDLWFRNISIISIFSFQGVGKKNQNFKILVGILFPPLCKKCTILQRPFHHLKKTWEMFLRLTITFVQVFICKNALSALFRNSLTVDGKRINTTSLNSSWVNQLDLPVSQQFHPYNRLLILHFIDACKNQCVLATSSLKKI